MEGKKLGGRYEIVSRVGGGGMAVVYKAKDLLLNRYVAIKVLSESLSNDSEFIRRFSREAQAAASLSHPNVVNVYDVGRDGYTHYIVMELIEGPTLKQYIQDRGPLPTEEAASIAMKICDGLAHAHDNQIVHRDIKPHNILLGSNGRVKVTDFGIARAASSSTITQQGSVMGSVHYFSPEQARGGIIDYKSDIYSLGIVFYEMVTGQLPFDGDQAIGIALKHLQEPVEDPRNLNRDLPDSVAEIILRAMEKDPVDRFASTRAMMQEISYAVPYSMDRNWAHSHRPKEPQYDGGYQTIAITDEETSKHTAVTTTPEPDHSYSPTSRPEIREGGGRKEVSSPSNSRKSSLGQQTLLNLEALKNFPSDKDKTLFQRTAIWLDNVQQTLPWWQKLIFGLITVALILGISFWVFDSVWSFMSGGSGSDQEQNASEEIELKLFSGNVEDAKKWLDKKGLKYEIKPESKPGVAPGDVWEQKPKSGTKVKPGDTVTLFVAPNGVPVKDFIGGYETDVKNPLQAGTFESKYHYKVRVIHCNEGSQTYKIYDQKPKPGEFISEDEVLEVYVTVPQVSGCSPAKYNKY
ncbi:Stk1 family PASTA domain-containing Ser/Thr kinase [Hazenella coriacea]|nr:Stk1 family PASTA domain-containing Ser/Thr kinase [Hazenella coriacea]